MGEPRENPGEPKESDFFNPGGTLVKPYRENLGELGLLTTPYRIHKKKKMLLGYRCVKIQSVICRLCAFILFFHLF